MNDEKILNFIVDLLKKQNFSLNNKNKDGRINSANSESIIIKQIANNDEFKQFLTKNNLIAKIPNIREWYDFLIFNEDNTFFCPINLKISNLNLNSSDNLNCKIGMYFCLTGKIPAFSNEINWSNFLIKLYSNMEDNNRDYYFLVINKENNRDIFFNSLKKLYELNPNGNNLPFQCVWNKNREKVNRTYEESKKLHYEKFLQKC
ncbi:hypothetical protein [Metamycoplasma hyosynoviae]|uniref:hypothetical protein n=1 Tax=Metamycoplasma hyosynoviae TaxID=29559 RepID=UPI00235E3849|nr:hypothetical protein [Metamycoplasma hyosynoviae]MDD1372294.1 hypothetical protein [Metamycoplasma hyosynoviae]MDI3063753.1 hypothetical protein [Metamycoplasma hyosynoviae]